MQTKKMVRIAIVSLCGFFAVSAAAQGWKPEQNVEISVGTGPGGGADRTARFIQKLIQEKKLMLQAVFVTNKSGGGGTIMVARIS